MINERLLPEGITLNCIMPSGPAGLITTCSARRGGHKTIRIGHVNL